MGGKIEEEIMRMQQAASQQIMNEGITPVPSNFLSSIQATGLTEEVFEPDLSYEGAMPFIVDEQLLDLALQAPDLSHFLRKEIVIIFD